MTLIELSVALAIGAIVSLGISAVFVFGVEQFQILVEKNQTEENILWASYYTRTILSQAVDLWCTEGFRDDDNNGYGDDTPPKCRTSATGYNTATPPSSAQPGLRGGNPTYPADQTDPHNVAAGTAVSTWANRGRVASYTTPLLGSATTVPIMVFMRERGAPNTPTGISDLKGGAVYFKPPTGNASGELQIFYADSAGLIDLSNPTFKLDRLTKFDIEVYLPIQPSSPRYSLAAQEAKVTIGARYFRSTKKSLFTYTPTPGAGTPAFKDLNMEIRVGFRNNALGVYQLGSGAARIERLHGNLYYFQSQVPTK